MPDSSTQPNWRLRRDPITQLPSINTFGGLSNFLREAVADEDSRMLSESMAELSVHFEAIIAALRVHRERDRLAPMLVDLLTVLRAHRQLVVNLGLPWRGLYEYAGYLQALNNLRVLIGQWLLEGDSGSFELPVAAEDFGLVAWRTLGEGMLMIDMYEQWLAGGAEDEPTLGPATRPHVQRAVQWWKKLRR